LTEYNPFCIARRGKYSAGTGFSLPGFLPATYAAAL